MEQLVSAGEYRKWQNSHALNMSEGTVHLRRDGCGASFDPAGGARNAMTWGICQELGAVCGRIAADAGARVAVFRGAGNKAFVAERTSAQFRDFKSAEDGVSTSARWKCRRRQTLPAVPTLAVVEEMGDRWRSRDRDDVRPADRDAWLALRRATRTHAGNCLSVANNALIAAAFGVARAKRMLLLAENLTAEEALTAGFLMDIVAPENLDARVAELCARLAGNAPLTMRATKEAIRRALHAGLPAGDDLIRECYGSNDFKTGVEAFLEKREPRWTGAGT
jgi:enoyl-CoA hydratase/carnithine racemase